MISRDYYLVLGVSRDETPQGLRRAFRRLAKKFHPDVVGPKWAGRFQEIVEAYEILSDPEKRRSYNKGLFRSENRTLRDPIISGSGIDPEPLVPQRASYLGHPRPFTDPIEAWFDRLLENIPEFGAYDPSPPRSLDLEVILSPEEAWSGGRLPLRFPAVFPCPDCGGSGGLWSRCGTCRGRGLVEEAESVLLTIPPRVRNNAVMEVNLPGLGVHNFFLRVIIRVA